MRSKTAAAAAPDHRWPGRGRPGAGLYRPVTLLCSPGTNSGTLVNGVCVLPAAAVGHQLLGPYTEPWDGTNWRIVATPAASASWPA